METKKAIRTKDGQYEVVKINRRRACRYMCLECMAWEEISTCTGKLMDGSACLLRAFINMQKAQDAAVRQRAITKHCYECMGGNSKSVTLCINPYCPLFPFRNTKLDKSMLFGLDTPDETVLDVTREAANRLMTPVAMPLKSAQGSKLIKNDDTSQKTYT